MCSYLSMVVFCCLHGIAISQVRVVACGFYTTLDLPLLFQVEVFGGEVHGAQIGGLLVGLQLVLPPFFNSPDARSVVSRRHRVSCVLRPRLDRVPAQPRVSGTVFSGVASRGIKVSSGEPRLDPGAHELGTVATVGVLSMCPRTPTSSTPRKVVPYCSAADSRSDCRLLLFSALLFAPAPAPLASRHAIFSKRLSGSRLGSCGSAIRGVR